MLFKMYRHIHIFILINYWYYFIAIYSLLISFMKYVMINRDAARRLKIKLNVVVPTPIKMSIIFTAEFLFYFFYSVSIIRLNVNLHRRSS